MALGLAAPARAGLKTLDRSLPTARIVLSQEPPQLDSTRATDQESSKILGHVLEGLTRLGPHNEVLPGVAERWELGEKRAVFYLRKNARWSDGTPVTAHDFVFAWRRVVDPKTASEYAFFLYPIKNAEKINQGKLPVLSLGVKAESDQKLVVEFDVPCGYFIALTSWMTTYPLNEKFFRAQVDGNGGNRYGSDANRILSNGPFILTEWNHGDSLLLKKSEQYWDKTRVKLSQIAVPYITPNSLTHLQFFREKKIDVLERVGRDELRELSRGGFKMESFPDGSVWYLEFNFREGRATRNIHLRRAMQLAFDRDEFVSRVIGIPGSKKAEKFIPSWVEGVSKPLIQEYPYHQPKRDLVKARAEIELAKADFGGNLPELTWLTDDTNGAIREAEYFQSFFKEKLGLKLKVDLQSFKQRLAKMTAGEFDIVSAGWGPDYADAMTFADLKTSWNGNNRGKWLNAKYDAAIKKAQGTSNRKVRIGAIAEAERILLDEIAVLPTFERVIVYALQEGVTGVVRRALPPDPDLSEAMVGPVRSKKVTE